MHYGVAVLKLKLNESESAKKKCSFLDYFFLSKLVHLHIFGSDCSIDTEQDSRYRHICIHCSQSFTLENYFVGNLFKKQINKKGTKGIFRRTTCRINYF